MTKNYSPKIQIIKIKRKIENINSEELNASNYTRD